MGKTSFLHRYIKNQFSELQISTLGVDFRQKEIKNDKQSYLVQIWDTAGQERFRSLTKTYYKKASGIILAYDCTNSNSFNNIKVWVEQIRSETVLKIPVVLISTKNDSSEKLVPVSQGKKLAKELNLAFFETSAKTGFNVEKVFEYVVGEVFNLEKETRDKVYLSASRVRKRKCC